MVYIQGFLLQYWDQLQQVKMETTVKFNFYKSILKFKIFQLRYFSAPMKPLRKCSVNCDQISGSQQYTWLELLLEKS